MHRQSFTHTHRAIASCLLATIASLILLAACGGDDDSESLTVYSGRKKELVGPLFDQFESKTGIELDVRYGNSTDLALLISEEGDRSPADVFFAQSPGAVGFLAEQGLLGEIDQSILEPVDSRARNDSGLWVGVTGRQRVLVYNENLVDASTLPSSVFDLTDQAYRGQVGIAPENSSFQDFVTALRQLEGEEAAQAWLEGMAANDVQTYGSNSAIVEAVGRGEVPLGLVNHYYNYRFLDEDPGLPSRNYVFPDGDIGALLMAAAVTVLAESDNTANAERLIEFLLSSEGQSYFADETFEYPLAGDTAPSADLPPLEELVVPQYDLDQLGGDLRATATMISQSGLAP